MIKGKAKNTKKMSDKVFAEYDSRLHYTEKKTNKKLQLLQFPQKFFTMNELSYDVKFSSNVASVKCSVISTSKLITLSSSLTKSFV